MRVHVSFDLYLPENMTPAQIDQWLYYELAGRAGTVASDNPMEGKPVQAQNIDWEER